MNVLMWSDGRLNVYLSSFLFTQTLAPLLNVLLTSQSLQIMCSKPTQFLHSTLSLSLFSLLWQLLTSQSRHFMHATQKVGQTNGLTDYLD